MSDNAIDMRAATDTPNPQIDDQQMSGRATEEAFALVIGADRARCKQLC